MRSLIGIFAVLPVLVLASDCSSTMAVVVKIPEGLVLAADGRAVFKNEKGDYRIASDNASKVFRLTEHCGCVVWGDAFIGDESVGSLMQQFRIQGQLKKDSTQSLLEVLNSFISFFADKKGNTHFSIVGYDSEGKPRVFTYALGQQKPSEQYAHTATGPLWGGQSEAINRILKGYDKRFDVESIIQTLDDPLIAQFELKPEKLDDIRKSIRSAIDRELSNLECIDITSKMALQDGIDFALFLIRTTIDYQRFTDGIQKDPGSVPGSGGSVHVAVITPDGFRWVQKDGLWAEPKTEQGGSRTVSMHNVK